ncbi:Uncharacterised protein [Legionella donaldsonii]|uniref:Uncharacterized protein n=1 Tax=Legionella donaldsonii TaxID=45060 RepID=A0A378JAP8_9GAMM|nr:Uncharacterised protein [Legionella donaldsonii]
MTSRRMKVPLDKLAHSLLPSMILGYHYKL